ncbi:MAG: Phosphoribosylaminoimidazole-succinocarboxamide synthase [Calditrichaeota bacterium]|nr:Phosphoribosylaminoimidazole-succinocarboxamide synthase [Calditrichota bacterium]
MAEGVLNVELPLPKVTSGKVRDIYDAGDDRLLLVTTDRLSAFDVVLKQPIPGRGEILNRMSLFWFGFFRDDVRNVVLGNDPDRMIGLENVPAELRETIRGRSVLMRKADPFPVECVVRGWLIGSGFRDYQETGEVCGIKLPPGLRKADRLPEPMFTPATKAKEGHDENISYEQVVKLVGAEHAEKLRELSLEMYARAVEYARNRGIVIADTKFEFGLVDDDIVLIDEVLTPDSSRFWPADRLVPGENPPSYDKQIVRDWLERSGWNKRPPPPDLPEEVIEKTARAYRDIFERLTSSTIRR